MEIWRLITHHVHPDEAATIAKNTGWLAVGWGRVGDLCGRKFQSASEISQAIEAIPAYQSLHNAGHGGASLWNFYTEMQIGDLVILRTKTAYPAVMRVTGEYEWVGEPLPVTSNPGDYFHRRRAEVTNLDGEELWRRTGGFTEGQNAYWTLARCRALAE